VNAEEVLHERARASRAESASLCARSEVLREQASLRADRLVRTLDGLRLGARGERFSLRLARLPAAVGLARRAVRRWLEEGPSPPDEVRAIVLACSEACANAVEHPVRAARQAFEIELARTATEITVVVRDFGRWREAGAAGERGRGLELIRSLMDETELRGGDRGTELVMRRARDAPA
jgi:anti-sigma regulatory factor (Ser/Thr protein kinase)